MAAVAATAAASEGEDAGQVMVSLGGMQNMAWAADTSKFGYKMLVKMGWSAGKGVGKDLQGQAAHVKIARRSENLGVGCSLKQAEVQGWSNTAAGFADVLKSLNKAYGSGKSSGSGSRSGSGSDSEADGSERDVGESDGGAASAKKSKKSRKEKREKKEKKEKKKKRKQGKKPKKASDAGEKKPARVSRRIHYHKRQRNKNAKAYDAQDMAAILGVASSAYTAV